MTCNSLDCGVTMAVGANNALGRIDQYELVRELGGGGFGAVYLAKDTVSGIDVAVKGLPPFIRSNREELENIRSNFALVSRLHHPNIAAALVLHPAKAVSYVSEDVRQKLRVLSGDTLMVMEYAPGVTLSQWRKQFPGRKVPLAQAQDIARQLASAIDYAHERKILHRDIKPANVMVETSDNGGLTVRILDFGLAAEIRSSMGRMSQEIHDTSGTRPYMAPEQWLGEKQGPATDQYSLAVLVHELLSGDVPFASVFETGDPVVMMNVVVGRPFAPSDDWPRFVRLALAKALAKKPEERFASCAEFADALEGKVKLPHEGGGMAVFAAAALASAVLAGVGWFAWTKCGGQTPQLHTPSSINIATTDLGDEGGTVSSTEAEEKEDGAVAGNPTPAPENLPPPTMEDAKSLPGIASDIAKSIDERIKSLDKQRTSYINQSLEAARKAKDSSSLDMWNLCIAECDKVLYWDAENAEAKNLKAEAERHLVPTARAVAMIGGREVEGAKFTFGGKTYIDPKWDELTAGTRLFGGGASVEYTEGGKRYVGTLGDCTVNWRGPTNIVVVLKEHIASKPPVKLEVPVAKPAVERDMQPIRKQKPDGRAVVDVRSLLAPVQNAESPIDDGGRFFTVKDMETVDPGTLRPGESRCLKLAGDVVLDLNWCPPGSFTMSAPLKTVQIKDGFWIGRYEVTQDVWEKVMKSNPSRFKTGGAAELPVERVSRDDCLRFVGELNRQNGTKSFRLPLDEEWEYACRAGSTTLFHYGVSGDSGKMRCRSNMTCKVGSYEPNDWGLFDMHGNVAEWCMDAYPTELLNLFQRHGYILRGGSYADKESNCSSVARRREASHKLHPTFGMRLCFSMK